MFGIYFLPAFLVFLLAFAPGSGHADTLAPRLDASTDLTVDGRFRLAWHWPAPPGTTFEVVESADPDFARAQTVYRGQGRTALLTGREDGIYHYRVRALTGDRSSAWSKMVVVTVYRNPWIRFAGLILVFTALLIAAVCAFLFDRPSANKGDSISA